MQIKLGTRLALALALCAAGACDRDTPKSPEATTASPESAPPTKRVVGPITEADAKALETMNDGMKTYVELHKKLEDGLPKLPDSATPQQIDTNQRELEKRVRQARASAKQGDIFTPQAQVVIKRLLAQIFDGPDGKQLKASILDEYTGNAKVAVNGRYPDDVPVSTVPPEVLQVLPKLAEDMEYRFIGDTLIILDGHAHVIADYIPDALPK